MIENINNNSNADCECEKCNKKTTTIKYISRFYDDEGFEVSVYRCLSCNHLIYIGEEYEGNYCTNCGKELCWR